MVDEIGVGGGVVDRLREEGFTVVAFNAGSRAQGRHADRFLNRRAQAFWRLRKALEDERVAVPPDRVLREELVVIRWGATSAGQVRIERKEELRQRLGRSPDRADALSMAVWAWERRRRREQAEPAARSVSWTDMRL